MSTKQTKFTVKKSKTDKQLDEQLLLDVPSNVTSISIEVKTDKRVWLTYMVYDENHSLRAQFIKVNAPQPLVIHEDKQKASPYTIFGPVKEGKWTIDLSVLTNEEIEASHSWCEFIITFNDDKVEEIHADKDVWQKETSSEFYLHFNEEKVFDENSKWYKGDFHTHTVYSDGEMTREENMESAKEQQLDFFVATEHNLVPTSWFEKTDILVIPGVEVTSPLGHFNIINTNTSPFLKSKMIDMYTEEGMNKLVTNDYGNSIISINHPFLTEWKWLLQETPLERVDTIEIWNDPTYPYNPQATEWALLAWDYLLNDGYKLTGIGGSDSHLKREDKYEGSMEPSLIGDPGTFVYCEQLTAANVVKGLKKGNVIVSRGVFIQFSIDDIKPGELCDRRKGVAKTSVKTDESIYIEWIVDGVVAKKDYTNRTSFEFDFSNQDSYHWIRVNVRYLDGRLYGFSNPIYFGNKQPKMKKWKDLIHLMEKHMK